MHKKIIKKDNAWMVHGLYHPLKDRPHRIVLG